MKKIYTFIFALLLLSAAKLEATPLFIIHPNDTTSGIAQFNNINVFKIYQVNQTSNTINLEWRLVSQNIPAGWDYSLCDYTNCYAGIPSTGSMSPLPVNDSGFIAVNINPYSISGNCTVRFYVYEASQPNSGDTLTYIIGTPNGIKENVLPSAFSLFPNPASSSVSLKLDSPALKNVSASIFDLNGRQLSAEKQLFDNVTILDISSFPEGTYIVRITSEDGIVSFRRFVKVR